MEHVRLGSSGLSVSAMCLGTMTFGLQCDEATSFAILDRALEAGISFIDTADAYPLGGTVETVGATEELLGRWLTTRRDEVVLATKCFYPMSNRPWEQGNGRAHIRRSVEASLRRLGTDRIELFQLHADDPSTPLEETLSALADLVAEGKISHVGVSNWPAWRIALARGLARHSGLARIDCVQPRYNLVFRTFERDLFPLCRAEGVGVIPYNPLAGGLLTGKHRPDADPAEGTRFTLGTAARRYQDRYWHAEEFETVERLRTLADESGRPLAELAIGWVAARPEVTAPIIGASRPEQLDAAVAVAESPLGADLLDQLDAVTRSWRRVDAER